MSIFALVDGNNFFVSCHRAIQSELEGLPVVVLCERLTGALLDRLTHHVHILEMNGESFRLASSKKQNRGTTKIAHKENEREK